MQVETIYSKSVEFKASESLESRRIPDYYTYLIKDGKLFSLVVNAPVEDSITVRTPIEVVEKNAFKDIQNWAVYSVGGSCVWVSPPARSDLSAKVVISEIDNDPEYGKILVNRNICFDWNPDLFLHFASYAGRLDIKVTEDLRGKPIFLSPKDHNKLFELLEELEPLQIEQVRSGEDIKIKENLKARMANGVAAPVGVYPLSCDGAFNVFSGLGGKYCKECPNCHRWIGKPISIGYKCEGCGQTKKC